MNINKRLITHVSSHLQIQWNYRFKSYFRLAENTRFQNLQTARGVGTLALIEKNITIIE
jgi:hypothetical protein